MYTRGTSQIRPCRVCLKSTAQEAVAMPQDLTVPYGYCHCGCGRQTSIPTKSDRGRGIFKGVPNRFITGHQNRVHPIMNDLGHFKIDGSYCRLIPLNKGQWAIVDEKDYERINTWKWYAHWRPTIKGYYAVRHNGYVNGKRPLIQMHNMVLELDRADDREVDHIDPLRTLENRRGNLRFATRGEQMHNQRIRKNNMSGYKGIYLNRSTGKWVAQITVNRKQIYLGLFNTKEEAYAAYCKAALLYHKEFARVI